MINSCVYIDTNDKKSRRESYQTSAVSSIGVGALSAVYKRLAQTTPSAPLHKTNSDMADKRHILGDTHSPSDDDTTSISESQV